ncbi:hypothetical protein LTR91_016439 [Friedmanniomyces endolithicus]|uniref:Uncharacterized protein n=1 Tax=Friedmanniomyces endolithicus TaxID=329885 RepID=A0AAN6K801_9PEZI|nr:hypothetical protein LTR94_023150 [Friedmanniomyces endolithicus]KAK0772494.1 hypothetical protein LTR38_016871 [Friedmanniomyces endolithicus]KAK0773460.1 hypothetical protein LTR75_017127 [Friedmanniomyces endolithicus]KAK0774195.1 hypothetical protein LTR59_014975 [Friedmanniomyces endolithicus]KAK0836449.1 hypothetical protein LTR03_013647 [Friedmanniomyces endolithicus]
MLPTPASAAKDNDRETSRSATAADSMPFDPYDERATMLCDDRSHLNTTDRDGIYMARKHCRHPKVTFMRASGTVATIHQRLLDCSFCTETEGSCSPGAQTPSQSPQSITSVVAEPTSSEKAVFERVLQGAFERARNGVKALCDSRLAPRTLPATPQNGAKSGDVGFRVREEDDWDIVDVC